MFKVLISDWLVLVLFVIDTRLATEVNLARGKPTSQSSTKYDALSNRVVDGNRNSSWAGGSCTHTVEDQRNPWWTVDLERPTNVGKVVFYNRQDCCAERANGFIVGLTNASTVAWSPTVGSYSLCGQHAGAVGAAATVFCSVLSPAARYVIVQLNRVGTLTICELEVYEDINECTLNISNCEQICTNTPGTYKCSCRSGYTLNADGCTCNDINECLDNSGNCSQFCTNTNGSYYCYCQSGYTLNTDNRTCDDINECSTKNKCSQLCSNTPGSYNCSCLKGFQLNVDNMTCDDIDECATNKNSCLRICTNTPGSFSCSCDSGYKETADGGRCEDIDECLVNNGSCSHRCTNTPGSYTCSCWSGYTMDNDHHSCTDIDECTVNNGICSQNCINIPGSYRCSCISGYAINISDGSCNDIDECTISNSCSHFCYNTAGSFRCFCEEGFTLNADHRTCKVVSDWPAGAKAAAVVLGVVAAFFATAFLAVLIICLKRITNLQRQLNDSTELKASNIVFSTPHDAAILDPNRIYSDLDNDPDNASNYQRLDTSAAVSNDERAYEQLKASRK